jgi:GalNAc-alpha-(1->4)-GalNAc-alpha-(1->3)-diNAcBac-PP-undecaprenol alpha-1,4-N-acetyl-D-galactosaminyltransferase
MNIIFSIPDMGMGGAERVISKLANYWADQHCISIVTLHEISSDFYSLNSKIERICIGLLPKKWYRICGFLGIALKLRSIYFLKNPDYILSFLPKMNILSLLALLFSKKKLVICERNIINKPGVSRRVNFFRKILYGLSYKITVQHEEIYNELLMTFPSIEPDKVIITPNPVDYFVCNDKINLSWLFNTYSPQDKVLVAVGRFTAVKAHDDTIIAFSILKKQITNIKLLICGNGNKLEECKLLVNSLNLADSVYFSGTVDNINSYYAAVDVFVTTTHFEGFPNALTEALSAGLPVVAFGAPSISVFVKDGYNGYVVRDRNHKEMADKIGELITNNELYTEFSQNARNISGKYSMEIIHKIWMEKVLC